MSRKGKGIRQRKHLQGCKEEANLVGPRSPFRMSYLLVNGQPVGCKALPHYSISQLPTWSVPLEKCSSLGLVCVAWTSELDFFGVACMIF